MLKVKVVESAETDLAAPIVFGSKKDGYLSFCVDYRRLNSVTVPDSYPVPRMDDCIDLFGDTLVFSTFHPNRRFWKVAIDDKHHDKTSFTSHHGLLRFSRKPSELHNAPGTFK